MARLLLLILFFLLPLPAAAGVVLADGQSSRPVAADLSYWRDDAGAFGHEAVLALPATAWKQNTEQVFSHGYNSATWWLRFDAGNPAPAPVLRLLEIAYPVLDEVEVWILQGSTVRTHYRLGDKRPFSARPIQHRFFVFPLNLPPESTQTILLRVRTTSAVQVPLTLWDARAYFEHDQSSIIAQGIYFGAMGLMAIYSLFVFLAMRERLYFYYVMYVVSLPVFLASINGFAFQYLWPEATQWNDQVLIVALAVTVFFGGLFTDKLLHIREEMPRFRLLIALLLVSAVLICGAAFFVSYALLIRVTIVVAATACLCFLMAGALRWYRGDVSARFYTIAWSSMLLGGVVMALNKFQLLPQNFFTENATQTGSAITLILLSFSLLTRINEERQLRFRAQQDMLASERRLHVAQSQALEAQREANEMLEQRVSERTQALEEANRKLAELSITDQLTGVRNRRHLDQVLKDEYTRCQRYQRPIAVVLLDIDHFKRFNDVWGHQVGDECLRRVGQLLPEAVRASVDLIARYGGEEFCVVLPETDAEGARVVGERIRQAVEAMQFVVRGEPVQVTMSVGVAACVPEDGCGCEGLMRTADMALYDAKGEGRNRVVVAG